MQESLVIPAEAGIRLRPSEPDARFRGDDVVGNVVTDYAIEAQGLVKDFGDTRAVDGIDLAVPAGSIYGVLGPNGAGKTTTLRMLLGIIDPDEGHRTLLGYAAPLKAAKLVGYLPEERGLYPSMTARDAIAFMGALRGLPLKEGKKRAGELLEAHGLGDVVARPIRTLSKGMAQTVQLLGTLVHGPRLIVLDEPFSGLDALNQGRLEALIRAKAAEGVTVLFSTHVIAHAERLCERIAIIAAGRVRFEGGVEEARGRLRPRVRLATRAADGPWRAALPPDAARDGGTWTFELPDSGVEPLLKALIDGGAGIETLSIERPGLHDAFVAIAGAAAAADMAVPAPEEVVA
jgi:ABC-2 type transport system ATP-binding protein